MEQARKNIDVYIKFHNQEKPHQNLGYKTPDEVHWAKPEDRTNYPLALG